MVWKFQSDFMMHLRWTDLVELTVWGEEREGKMVLGCPRCEWVPAAMAKSAGVSRLSLGSACSLRSSGRGRPHAPGAALCKVSGEFPQTDRWSIQMP